MKLRIKANSIRLRLTQTEVKQLAGGETVSERTRFPGTSMLTYSIRRSRTAARVMAGFDGIELLVTLPDAAAQQWCGGNQIGIEANVPNGDDSGLHVLIEKDFACLNHREDECDAFPNPASL